MAKNPTLQLVPSQVILPAWISTRQTEIYNSKCYNKIQKIKFYQILSFSPNAKLRKNPFFKMRFLEHKLASKE